MNKQRIKELIPLGLTIVALAYTTIIVLTTNTTLTYQHWIAFGLIFVVLVTTFINSKLSNIVLGLTLVLGFINIAAFTPTITTIGAGLSFAAFDAEITLGIQLFSFLVFLTFVYAHRKGFMEWINKDGL